MDYAGVIFQKGRKLLLQLRDEKARSPNTWGIFGGGIEKGETPIEAAIREIKEELNICLRKDSLKLIKVKRNKKIKYYIYKSEFLWGNKKINLKEGKKARFFSVEEISKTENVLPQVRKFTEEMFN